MLFLLSLARDIGKKLGVGGYVSNLRRTRVGEYLLKDCVEFDELDEYFADFFSKTDTL
ncbi:hypothetical protein ACFL1M_04915 [Patescibacteria group bacterium]